jgi:two-component system nitrate/nitrite response regulator NarL
MSGPIRIILIDDHTLFRKGLCELIERHGKIKVVAMTGSPYEARELLREHKPDVAVFDLNMPDVDGITLVSQLREEGHTLPILLLTVSDAQEDLAAALRVGARGYLLKDMEPDDVEDAIERAARGETVVAPKMTAKLVNLLDQKQGSAESLLSQLTQRERQILVHLSRGESNKTIARALDISHDTVKLHVRHILAKLNLSSRVEAAVFAVENKLTTPRAVEGN